MPISQKDAQLLKQPFGTLIPDKEVTKRKMASMLKGDKVIAVGDATTERLASFGIVPDVAVIDGKERRTRRSPPDSYPAKEMKCTNPAGTITKEAVKVLQDAIKARPPVRVLVEGEEDLLALPVFAAAPEGSAVLYGQPLEGLVVVRITPAKQKQAKDLMENIFDIADFNSSHSIPSTKRKLNGTPKKRASGRPKPRHSIKKDRRLRARR